MSWLEELQVLSPAQIRMIDDLLGAVGPFGEVRLSIQDGKLRFAALTQSIDVNKYDSKQVRTIDLQG